jgi:arylsulfatase A-like enzyme
MRISPLRMPSLALSLAVGTCAVQVPSAGGAVLPEGDARAAAPRPNVLVIVTDDQRGPNTMEFMPRTMARLRASGTQFTPFYATTPSCCPSRASLMTGRYVHNTGVLTELQATSLGQATTVQAYLKGAGYQTAMAGKFLNSWNLTVKPSYFDHATVTNSGAYFGYPAGVDGVRRTVSTYSTTYFGNAAIRYLNGFEAHDAQPWYLYLAPTAPHAPYTPEPRYAAAGVGPFPLNPAVGDDPSDQPPYIGARVPPSQAAREAVRANQLRTLMSVDDMVSRMLDALRTGGELASTLIVFTSDNGYTWGERRSIAKFMPYRETVRVPMILRWPGRVAAGAADHRVAGLIDIAPTVLEAAGVAPNPNVAMDGRSLLGPPTRNRILLEYPYDASNLTGPPGGWAATETPTSTYVEDYDSAGALAFQEYYDLRADPWQTRNLLADRDPANDPNVTALHAQLASGLACAGSTCP